MWLHRTVSFCEDKKVTNYYVLGELITSIKSLLHERDLIRVNNYHLIPLIHCGVGDVGIWSKKIIALYKKATDEVCYAAFSSLALWKSASIKFSFK